MLYLSWSRHDKIFHVHCGPLGVHELCPDWLQLAYLLKIPTIRAMRYAVKYFSGLIAFIAMGNYAAVAGLNLIPWPDQVEVRAGAFVLNAQTTISADPPFIQEARQLADVWKLAMTTSEGGNQILLTTNGSFGLPEEGYHLSVAATGVVIQARSAAGAFYGCQTLQQLAGPASRTIPGVHITDAPRYVWRGLLLDVSRHFFDQPTLLQVLDWMAAYKLNRFHLHLTDNQAWRLEVGGYPELTGVGARGSFTDSNAPPRFFSKAEMQEIIGYAARKHIVVVPEIDMPGHAGAATRTYPTLDGQLFTYDPVQETTYEFLQKVLLDVMQTFPSPWIHFGGDEVNTTGWDAVAGVKEKLHAEGLERPQQLEGYFVRRMSQFIAEHGHIPLGWDEIVSARPATNTVIFWWRHNKPEILAQALTEGYSVVLTPRSPCYFDYPQDKAFPNMGWKLCNTPEIVYRGPLIPTNLPPVQLQRILGVEGCVWTEHISSRPYLEFMIMPRLLALAEMAWTSPKEQNYARFSDCLKPIMAQCRQDGIQVYSAENPIGSHQEATRLERPPATSRTVKPD